MGEAVLGIDIGTTSTKAVLFDPAGVELATTERSYRLRTPRPGWAEQQPADLWQAVVGSIRAVMDAAGPGTRVRGLALAAQSGSLIPARADGRPVYPAITWLDRRAAELVGGWRAEGVGARVRQLSGWTLAPGLGLANIAWLRRFEPDIFDAAERYFSINDYVVYRLTGRCCTNPSNAGGMQLLDVTTARWSPELCALAGIDPGRLSPVQSSGAVVGPITPEASRLTGLPPGTPVVNGGHDQGCAALGLGVTAPGRTLLAGGTAWVVTTVVDEAAIDALPAELDLSRHAAPQRWTASRSLGGLGAWLDWWLDRAGQAGQFAALERGLATTGPGGGGLFFLPPVEGSQGGGFAGLQLSHTRADLARAVMEGAAFELRRALARFEGAGLPLERLWLIGGAARSSVWPAIVANVTGRPLAVSASNRWPALGAAILAGAALGLFESIEAGPVREVEPDEELTTFYEECFATYRQIASKMERGSWGEDARVTGSRGLP